MRKVIYFLLTLSFIFSTFVTVFSQEVKPEKVRRIVYEIKPNEWYKQQAKLWKKEIEKDPQNAGAWHNYYNAVRYEDYVNTISTKEKQEKLRKIVENLEKNAPESFECYYLKYFNSRDKTKNISLIEKAQQIDPSRPDVYYELITHNEIKGNEKQVTYYYQQLYKTKDISPQLVNYNYNVLMSTEENAILFTNGDNDTYPARMLQEAKGIRKDVLIINIPMSGVESFLKRKLKSKNIKIDCKKLMKNSISVDANQNKAFSISTFVQELSKQLAEKHPEYPIYFASTVYQNHYATLKDDLYSAGLAFLYSKERIDNIALIKKNFEKNYRLDGLNFHWYGENEPINSFMKKINMNYVAPIIMLAEHYKTSGQPEKIVSWKNLAIKIGKQAGNEDVIKYFEDKGM
ncbi:hypothetical protein ISS22_07235 [candidate division KSB1 bacterium]|nr:hypothetical protein [candidate division KSB1 bacterium]